MWRKGFTLIRLALVALALIFLLASEWPTLTDERRRLTALVGPRQFDFVRWELNALETKVRGAAGGAHTLLAEAERKQFVLDYLELLGRIRQLEAEIDAIFIDPEVAEPAVASRSLQAEVADLRGELEKRQAIAEAVMQDQVAAVLVEEGFEVLGMVWPPVAMTMTPLPQILIVSPREEIRQKYNVPLLHNLTVPEKEALENAVYGDLAVSALVVPIGGLGIFPSMIVETTSVNYLADVVAHEWAHHWLTLRPIGLSYAASPEMRTINETVASIVGEEIGAEVVARYYPELVPRPEPVEPPLAPEGERPFDFRLEMAETRVEVDRLLAAGRVEEAEAYMEARRQSFVAQGYRIRRLNQAYFAFYGAYADTPGASGADPVGPTVVAIRERSPYLRVFMDRVAGVTSFAELQEVLAELPASSGEDFP